MHFKAMILFPRLVKNRYYIIRLMLSIYGLLFSCGRVESADETISIGTFPRAFRLTAYNPEKTLWWLQASPFDGISDHVTKITPNPDIKYNIILNGDVLPDCRAISSEIYPYVGSVSISGGIPLGVALFTAADRLGFMRCPDLDASRVDEFLELPNINVISVSGCEKFDDWAIAKIKDCGRIKRLLLREVSVSGDGFLIGEKPSQIEALSMESIQNVNIEILFQAKLPKLKKLRVAHCNLDSSSIRFLAQMRQLEEIDISANYISEDDIGCEDIMKLGFVRKLNIDQNNFTKEYVDKIKKALPETNVHFIMRDNRNWRL